MDMNTIAEKSWELKGMMDTMEARYYIYESCERRETFQALHDALQAFQEACSTNPIVKEESK
jgi:hypothetical protein